MEPRPIISCQWCRHGDDIMMPRLLSPEALPPGANATAKRRRTNRSPPDFMTALIDPVAKSVGGGDVIGSFMGWVTFSTWD